MFNLFSRLVLRLWGWKLEGTKPDQAKYVLLMVPHTSQWDGVLFVLAMQALDLKINWLVAKDGVPGLLGIIVKRLGAITVDRSKNTNLADMLIGEFAQREQVALAIAPMGVTRYSDSWRSGFYRIAQQADVPLAFSYLDWGTKRLGIGDVYHLTGDVGADMDVIRAFYDGMTGKFPENVSKIYLKLEDKKTVE